MLYHYFGDKEALWLAVLEHAYLHIRSEERELDVSRLSPVVGMRRLVEFTVGYVQSHPEFISLLLGENLHRARYLRRSRKVRDMHTSLLGVIADLLKRGTVPACFAAGVDPAELYITIAALGFFYFSNIHTLSTIFGRNFNSLQRDGGISITRPSRTWGFSGHDRPERLTRNAAVSYLETAE